MSRNYSTMSGSRVFAAYLGDIRYELTKMARTPAFAVPTIIFPAMFYLLFGIVVGGKDPQALLQGLARWGVFGVMAPGLFGFGVSLAFEREYGQLILKQALPMPPGSYLVGRMVNAMVFVSISALLMLSIAVFAGHVQVGFGHAAQLLLVAVLGVLPFCAIGLFVGSLISGQAAPAIINLIYLPMAFLSGLLVPLQFLPKVLQTLGPLWPAHHLAQLSLAAVGAPSVGTTGNHVAALTGITVLFFVMAMRRLSSSGISLFGKSGAAGLAFPLRRALSMVVIGVSIGLIVVGVMGGTTPQAAANTAATSKGTEENGSASAANDAVSAGPVGVAAPDTPVVSDFDEGSAKTLYGIGWSARGDQDRGGNSTISQKVIDGGAENSKGALEISGEIGNALQFGAYAGTNFLPNGTPQPDFSKQGYMDYSAKHTLRFYARGDGHSYLVMFIGLRVDGMPPSYGFTAGPAWQEVRVPLHDVGSLDLQRVKVISIGSMNPGPFRLDIDNVRIE